MQHTIVLLSDIHANTAAFDAVMDDARRYINTKYGETKTRVWCLGDLIGRGPEPRLITSLERLYLQMSVQDRRYWLAGNHDWMVLDRISTLMLTPSLEQGGHMATLGGMEPEASDVACFHRIAVANTLKAQLEWLGTLPVSRHHVDLPHLYAVHGQYYLDNDGQADQSHAVETYSVDMNGEPHKLSETRRNLRERAKPDQALHVLLFGHTHHAGVWIWDETTDRVVDSGLRPNQGARRFDDLANQPVFINPGSVGFPRAPVKCPTYAVLQYEDSMEFAVVELRATSYDYTENEFPKFWSYPEKYLKEMQGCNGL